MILRKNEDLVTVKNKKDKRELILEGNLVIDM